MTLERLIFERAGLLHGQLVAAHLQAWVVATRKLGKFPTTVEFAAVHRKSERQAWRYRATVRRYFTEDEFRTLVTEAASNGHRDPLQHEVAA